MIRLLVVDDHQPTRAEIISQLTEGGLIQVVGEAETSDQAWRLSEKLLPDIVLLDLHLPGLIPSIDLVKRLTALRNVKVIAFAGQSRGADVQDFLSAGAAAYIAKGDSPELVKMSLLMVSRGTRNVLSPSLPRQLTKLSGQERNLLREITKRGKLPKAAERLGIAEEELTRTLGELAHKLDLNDIDGLVKWAKKHGF
jgi:DNA-binding NarL/FixJ family response regulator